MWNSIKLKLVILFLGVFSVFFASLEVFLYYELESVVVNLADEHLKSEVGALANLLAIEEKHGQLETELAEMTSAATDVYAQRLSGHYYQIVSNDGEILASSPSLYLADATLPAMVGENEPKFLTTTGPTGVPIRMMVQSFEYSIGKLTFVAGDSLEDTQKLISSFRSIVLAIFPAVFVVSVAGVYILSGWALKPIRSFSGKVNQISEESLDERIEQRRLPAELKPLAQSFNSMLARLEASFSKQKQFLSDASHELRTPTTIIKSFCDVTLGKDRSADHYRDAIHKISDTVNRMCSIINRILVISRLDTKAIQFKPVRVDLTDVLADVIRLIEPSAQNKGVKMSLSGGSVTIRGDREGLTEAFTNIVENAVKYNRPEGRVDITVSSGHDTAVITVKDTGIGIPDDERDRIFDRFYRADSSRSVTVGSGLGLSIVRSIVEEHGGRVEVESDPGQGSVFTVRLPLEHDFNGRSRG